MAEGCVDGYIGAWSGDVLSREGVPVIVDFSFATGAGEDAVDGRGALSEYGSDEEGGAEEELSGVESEDP